MEPIIPILEDLDIQKKVESVAGTGAKIVQCHKTSNAECEERLLVNGFPIALQGEEGAKIKEALLNGLVPTEVTDLLNNILLRAGILSNPVELETITNMKSTTKTTELLTLRDKNGMLVDERLKEVEEDDEIRSKSTELWKREDEKENGKETNVVTVTCPPLASIADVVKTEENCNKSNDSSIATGTSGL